ncbi:glycosyltransferase family 4 protein [Litorihabitans aurantiacus]|uniref:glycosyltransferase family 4 protein n=1 Tax=Litorihabitans aurantiacus TaxID=1930061 RepID=UPI0024E0EB3F|nr:glycosyltransferase family 4 protein [Litorihabitans aurantiacus]
MRIGIVCPYSLDAPGGVQVHVTDLAKRLLDQGHHVRVLAPADDGTPVPDFVEATGRSLAVRYNGSVARLSFGPVTAVRVRSWLEAGDFDVLHIHEPLVPSTGLIALWQAEVPVVATFHTANDRSRAMQVAYPMLRPTLERIAARIAVSEEARRTVVEHMGGDAVVIPNGVELSQFRASEPRAAWTGTPERPTLAFLGRTDEPRKGLDVLLAAVPALVAAVPGIRVLVAGRGDLARARAVAEAHPGVLELLGEITEEDKAALLRSVDLYVAPQTGARASASCWSRRWPPAPPSWRATSRPSAASWTRARGHPVRRRGPGRPRRGRPGRARRSRRDGAHAGPRHGLVRAVRLGGRDGAGADGLPARHGRGRAGGVVTTEIVLAVVVVVGLLVWLALAKANRLDLLHQKVTRTAATLDAQLLRRAGQAAELAASGRLDPASSLVLAGAADACLASGQELELTGGTDSTGDGTGDGEGRGDARTDPDADRRRPGRVTLTAEREIVESDLSRVLRQALEGPLAEGAATAPVVRDVVATAGRVELARRFHNDAVAQSVRIRAQALVRLLRLAGRADLPRSFEMDDTAPRLRPPHH